MAKQAPLTTSKMFTAHWTERDEAVLVDLLQRKIKELKWDMRDCDSPYARAKLKNTRAEYKKLLEKVQRGDYDPNILAAEMQSHAAYNSLQRERREQSLGKYVDAYSDVNFDFESYFKKTRYFGAACPLVMMILIIALLAVMLCSAFLSPDAIANIEYNVSGDINMSLTSIGYIKLGPNELDFQVDNDGNWPTGTWADASEMYEQGEKYQDANHQTPDKVWLYADLHMTSINITVFDVIKAWFRTPMLSETRIDIIENLDSMQGTSWYYQRFMRERSDNIAIEKDENGDYNALNIVRHIATYGTIIFLIAAIILCVVELVINIGRLFSYTSRRIHVIPILILLFMALSFISPAFLELTELNGDSVSTALANYFTIYWEDFINGENIYTCFNMLYMFLLAIPFVIILLPLIFRNRAAKTVAYVPKGNKKHTYAGQKKPTKAGQPGDPRAPRNTQGKAARAGPRAPTTSLLPGG